MTYRCEYCHKSFTTYKLRETHIIAILITGEGENFCSLMLLQIKLTKWLQEIF